MNSRMRRQRIGSLLFLIFLTLAFASVVPAQQKERTLDEIKARPSSARRMECIR